MSRGLKSLLPGVQYGVRVQPDELSDAGGGIMTKDTGSYWFVDGDKSAGGSGTSWDDAFATIQAAIDAAGAFDVIYIAAKTITDATGDPANYTENLSIPLAKSSLALVGVSRGRTQGGLPQLKTGTTTTSPLLTVSAPGCLITGIGFNGAGCTGGGILLNDDNSTASAFGTSIVGNHFKNCKGTTATDSRTGGAIMWTSAGNAWQVLIKGNRFYKNVGDVVLKGTSNTVPQDVIIEDNDFSGPAANVDCNLYLAGGSGMNGVTVNNNRFQQLPAIGSGSVARYIDATGCTGMLTNNTFGCQTGDTGGTKITFKAAGTGAKIPATMHVARNYGQSITASETGEINIA